MKKVLFGAALAASLVGFGDISSANVVGYLDYPLVAGYNLFTPAFEAVSGSLSIQDVKIKGSEGWGTEIIWCLDEGGVLTGVTYSWQCPDASGLDDFAWIDGDGNAADVPLTDGEGFYLYADSEDLVMQSSGQVKVGGYERDLVAGYNITGNFSPVDLSLQDVKIMGSEGWGTEIIWCLDEGGVLTGVTYSWQCPDASGLEDFAWIDGDGAAADVSVKAGEALYLYADSEGLKLTLPAAIPAPAAK